MDNSNAPGGPLPGHLALPPAGHGPGVLVLHAWWGLNPFFVTLCDRLAGAGFVALAPDLYDGAVVATPKEAEEKVKALDDAAAAAKVLGALDALRQHPAARGTKVGALGCSLGAFHALQLSAQRPEDVAAVVDYYGVVEGPDFGAARAAYLCHFAERDDFDPVEAAVQMVDGMRAVGRDVRYYVYPGVRHWFIEEDRPDAYDADAARLAWDRTIAFLHERLG